MKKFCWIVLALLILMCFAFSACSDTSEDLPENNDTVDTENDQKEDPEKDPGSDDKTPETEDETPVEKQKKEIKLAMERAINTEVAWKEVEEYNPTLKKYKHIKAITYDGLEYQGQKTKIFAYVGFPETASADDPVPAVVLVHGGLGHPYLEWVAMWNKRGYAAIAMETTGCFPTQPNACVNELENSLFAYEFNEPFYEEGYVLAPQLYFPKEYTPVEDQWAYHAISQVILAHNVLRQDDRVDSSNIGITGISWGGIITSQVIGYDDRFSFAIPVYGTAYLGEELHPSLDFDHPYIDALWGAAHNLDNADMPILWLAYNDDSIFGIPSYVKSYQHTADANRQNVLAMLGGWEHSHIAGYSKPHIYAFADWVTFGDPGFITFKSQPEGREINCKIDIPGDVKGTITADIYYITEPMSYSVYDKFGWGSQCYLDQEWQKDKTSLTVNRDDETITGTVPEDAAGYYIQVNFILDGSKCNSSSIYVALD